TRVSSPSSASHSRTWRTGTSSPGSCAARRSNSVSQWRGRVNGPPVYSPSPPRGASFCAARRSALSAARRPPPPPPRRRTPARAAAGAGEGGGRGAQRGGGDRLSPPRRVEVRVVRVGRREALVDQRGERVRERAAHIELGSQRRVQADQVVGPVEHVLVVGL